MNNIPKLVRFSGRVTYTPLPTYTRLNRGSELVFRSPISLGMDQSLTVLSSTRGVTDYNQLLLQIIINYLLSQIITFIT